MSFSTASSGEDTPATPRWHLTIPFPGEYQVPAGSVSTPVYAVATLSDPTAAVDFMEIAYTDNQPGGRDYDCAALLHTAEKIDKDNAYTVRFGAEHIGRDTPGYPEMMKFRASYDFATAAFTTSTPGKESVVIQNRKPLAFENSKVLYASCWFARADGHAGPKVSELRVAAHVSCAHMPGAVMLGQADQTVQWRPSPASEAVAQKLYRAEAPGGPFTLAATFAENTTSSYKDASAENGKTYYYKVVAESAGGVAGAESNVLTAAVLPQTRLECADAAATYGDRTAVLSATVTSGGKAVDAGTVTFQLKAGETPVGDAVTAAVADGKAKSSYAVPRGTDVGRYMIVASYSGGGKFTGSADSSKQLTISPAALNVNPINVTRAYGEPNPEFTGDLDGLLGRDNLSATFTTTATAASAPGNYTIVAALVNPENRARNYKVTLNEARLLVTPSEIFISAANASRTYGMPNPEFTGTIKGIVNADKITGTYACGAVMSSRIGNYTIAPTLVGDPEKLSRYNIVPTHGTFAVTPAPLTASALNATRSYGAANPVFSGMLSGVLNGDNILATYDTSATPESPAGVYPIVPELRDAEGKLSNYAPKLSNGTLVITKATLTVTPADAARQEGAANPAFTGTISGIQNGDPITARYSSSALQSSPEGTYPITAVIVDPGKRLGNYEVKANVGTLTVQKRPSSLLVWLGAGGAVCVVGAGVWWLLRRGKSATG